MLRFICCRRFILATALALNLATAHTQMQRAFWIPQRLSS